MRAEFKAIDVGCGDCLFLSLSNKMASFNIMIDCQNYDKAKDYVINKLHNHIDFLIVTHIDNDHVPGVTDMINKNKDLYIGQILFNCYQREPLGEKDTLPEKTKQRLLELKDNIPIIADAIDAKIGSDDARLLSEAILRYEERSNRKVWKRDYITCNSDVQLGEGGEWGTLKFLSPSQAHLDELDVQFRRMFRNLMYGDLGDKQYEENVSIYELMVLYVNQQASLEGNQYTKIASMSKYTENALRKICLREGKETRIENKTSIAFAWDYDDKPRMMFFGDAAAPQLVEQIRIKYSNLPLLLDLIKVSHHGSFNNTSNELLQLIDAQYYVLSGGKGNSTPHLITMGKIIQRPLPNGVNNRIIYYTKKTPSIAEIISNQCNLNTLPNFEFRHNDNTIVFTY